MYAQTNGAVIDGLDGKLVIVEVNITSGLPHFDIVGLPNTSVREARERVRAAITNSGLEFPMKRIIVNLAPAELKKNSAGLDLAICMGILGASGQIRRDALSNAAFVGELSLEGEILPVNGVLAMAIALANEKKDSLWTAAQSIRETSLSTLPFIYGFSKLEDVLKQYKNPKLCIAMRPDTDWKVVVDTATSGEDINDIKGQAQAKRALMIAAAGGHNILMSGPPGGGKTMLARRMHTIMPALTKDEMVEVTKIYSIAGLLGENEIIMQRPFRHPHHTITTVGMAGGGNPPRPGEITLSHRGILFLDEVAEFNGRILEILRQPVEEGIIHISRQRGTYAFPADMIVIMALNPCPCGYYGYEHLKECICRDSEVQRYRKRISGPLLDRMDIRIRITPPDYESLIESNTTEKISAEIREQVIAARHRQQERLSAYGWSTNSNITTKQSQQLLATDTEGELLLRDLFAKFHISARAYYRILKVARTIADLNDCEKIQAMHIAEAANYRGIDF